MIVSDLTSSISHSIELLLIAVLLVMAATLGLVFTGRPRLLPLALALLAAALTFGALSAVGASLTMASIAVLPVLVGLAVDYAIQFQARVGEELERTAGDGGGEWGGDGRRTGAGRARGGARRADDRDGRRGQRGGDARAAALARADGPRLRRAARRRGGDRAAVRADRGRRGDLAVFARGRRSRRPTRSAGGRWRPRGGARVSCWRTTPLTRLIARAALVGSVRHPGGCCAWGWRWRRSAGASTRRPRCETDITKLVPQNLSSLQNLNTLEQITGVGGEIELMVEGSDLTKPSTIEWMIAYQKSGARALRLQLRARLRQGAPVPGLLAARPVPGQARTAGVRARRARAAPERRASVSAKLTQGKVSGLLRVIPPYFSQDVITPDRRVATLAFGIRLMGLDQQQRLIEQMRSSLHPPAGVSASLVGLPVLAAQSGSQVADPWRRLETLLAGLAAVALVLLLAFRGDRRRALVPLVPIVLATGWSALILFAVRVPLNPMSVTLGALVIAISTEFSVLLSERHRQEQLAGYDTIEALRRSYRRTGAAVAASGVTAIAGFGVLVLSDIRMLRDFGLVTLIDLSVSLVGVLIALPATLVIADAAAEAAVASSGAGGAACAGSPSAGWRAAPTAGGVGGVTWPAEAGSGHEPSSALEHDGTPATGVGRVAGTSADRATGATRPARAAAPGAGHDQHRLTKPNGSPASHPGCRRRSRCRWCWGTSRATRTSPRAPDQGAGREGARVHRARAAGPERLRALRTGTGGAGAVRRRRLLPGGPGRHADARAVVPGRALRGRLDQGRTRHSCAGWCARAG